uniref:PH domain-containing protein n=1 Tax=Lotharella oceanica TaxID=641309 RepID=A0A7S2U2V3_9EUKA
MSVISDYFYKESASFPYLWQKRFFQLFEEDTGNYILYRVREGDGKPKGRIPIGKIMDVIPYTSKPTEQRFKILIPNRTYYMKATSVDMRKRWDRAIRASIKKMEQGGSKQEGKSMKRSVEDLATVMAMQELVTSVNNGMKFLNEVLSSKECFNEFAKHMGMNSYFDLAAYPALFEKLYRSIYSNAKFTVEVKLENTSSNDLAKEQFEKFLFIVEQRPLLPGLKGADLEKRIAKASAEVVKITEKYQKEAEKINKDDITNGINLIVEFFRMLI